MATLFKTDVPLFAIGGQCAAGGLALGAIWPRKAPWSLALVVALIPIMFQLLWLSRSGLAEDFTVGYLAKTTFYLALYVWLASLVGYLFVRAGQHLVKAMK